MAEPKEKKEPTEGPAGNPGERGADLAAILRLLLPLGLGVGAVALGFLRGPAAGVLAFAGAALLSAIALFWASLRVLAGDAPLSIDAAVHLGSPGSRDEQKRAILRALKDLDQERALGKLTDEDHAQLTARYREEAKSVLRAMDASLGPSRERAEALVAERLAGGAARVVEEEARPAKRKRKSLSAEEKTCSACGTANEPDATFCKSCGDRMTKGSPG